MSSEQAFGYNGPLSTYVEWDATIYGAAVGLLLSIGRVRDDIRKEPSKFIGAILAVATVATLLRRLR